MNNLSDNEIIKALECCIKECDYEHCPYYVNDRYECGGNFEKDIFDLINRQKAEIERLKNKVEELSEVLSDTIRIRYAEAKAEAVKEFAERLKTKERPTFPLAMVIDVYEIDNLVKEMVGETNEQK